MQAASKNYFPHLDGLRALATLLILWVHSSEQFFHDEPSGLLRSLCHDLPRTISMGRTAVATFFIISGFLIARSLDDKDAARSFLLKRALRLFPAYWVSMALVLAIGLVPFEWPRVLANLTMMPSALGQPELLGIYWTLQTEVVFYTLYFAAFILGIGRTPRALAGLSITFTTVFIATRLGFDTATLKSVPLAVEKIPQHLGIMFFGAYLYKVGRAGMLSPTALALFGFTLAPPLFTAVTYLMGNQNSTPPVMLGYLYALVLCWAVIFWEPRCPAFLRYVGKISYSVYLNHALVILLILQFWPKPWPPPLVGIAFVYAASIALSHVTFHLIERPAMQLGRRARTKSADSVKSS